MLTPELPPYQPAPLPSAPLPLPEPLPAPDFGVAPTPGHGDLRDIVSGLIDEGMKHLPPQIPFEQQQQMSDAAHASVDAFLNDPLLQPHIDQHAAEAEQFLQGATVWLATTR